MSNRMIFVNLPVLSIPKSIDFYTSLGFVQNKKFSGDSGVMMVIPPEDSNGVGKINVMLLTHDFFKTFLPSHGGIASKGNSEVLLCLSAESKTEVDEWIERAEKAGSNVDVGPKQEHGDSMYGRSFADLDGHIWEIMWMKSDNN